MVYLSYTVQVGKDSGHGNRSHTLKMARAASLLSAAHDSAQVQGTDPDLTMPAEGDAQWGPHVHSPAEATHTIFMHTVCMSSADDCTLRL